MFMGIVLYLLVEHLSTFSYRQLTGRKIMALRMPALRERNKTNTLRDGS
jgi:hypothetical protein